MCGAIKEIYYKIVLPLWLISMPFIFLTTIWCGPLSGGFKIAIGISTVLVWAVIAPFIINNVLLRIK